ncbi:MAG: HIT family protein [Janthinobacterium lividum]
MTHASACPLCTTDDGQLIWRDAALRVVQVDDADYPGFCRVIWQDHQPEMTDLDAAAQHHLLDVVLVVEQVLRDVMQCDKINLASLGNQVPHLHWHVIPRFTDDAHFPKPVWADAQRTVPEALHAARVARAGGLAPVLRTALDAAFFDHPADQPAQETDDGRTR